MNYYERLKDLREDNDYTQSDIAEFLHINRSTYANWENGETLIPLAYLDQLTLFYNTSMSYILGLEDSYDKNNKIIPAVVRDRGERHSFNLS